MKSVKPVFDNGMSLSLGNKCPICGKTILGFMTKPETKIVYAEHDLVLIGSNGEDTRYGVLHCKVGVDNG